MSLILVTSCFTKCFVKRVGDLQPTDECCHHNIFIAVIYQSHLALLITDVVLEALSGHHLDGEEVVAIHLEFTSGHELIAERLLHLLEVLK